MYFASFSAYQNCSYDIQEMVVMTLESHFSALLSICVSGLFLATIALVIAYNFAFALRGILKKFGLSDDGSDV